MTEKNKKLEIASAIVGGLYAAIHVVLAVGLSGGAAVFGDISTAGMGIVAIFFYAFTYIAVIFAIAAVAAAIWCVAVVIIPLRTKSVTTVRRVAISAIVLLILRMLIDINFVFGFVVNGFRYGDYLRAIITILFIILTLTWFVLNIIRIKIYKTKRKNYE